MAEVLGTLSVRVALTFTVSTGTPNTSATTWATLIISPWHEWGIVNRVCDDPLAEALGTAEKISENAPPAVRQAKKSIHYGLQSDLLTGYRFEIEAYNQLVATDDRKEGVRAFNEKRKPRFQGK